MSEINQNQTNNEVDLVDLIKALWLGKWKIIIITIISVLVVYFYSNSLPEKYKVSTKVLMGDNSSFIKYSLINDILEINDLTATKNQVIPNKYILDSSNIFIKTRNEFNNYQAVVSVLENETSVLKSFDGTDEEKQELLFNLARSFNILAPKEIGGTYKMTFTWGNIQEGKEIFIKSMAIVMENVRKSVIKDIINLANVIEKDNQKKIDSLNLKFKLLEKAQKEKDMARIEYLKEQSNIAKEINL